MYIYFIALNKLYKKEEVYCEYERIGNMENDGNFLS